MSGFGYVKDPHDERDHKWSDLSLRAIPLPAGYARPFRGSVLDQGQFPHCVAFSSASMKMTHEHMKLAYPRYATKWLYDECKKIDGIPDQEGTFIRCAMQIMQQTGYKRYSLSLYDKIKSYVRISTTQEIKEAVYTVGPVVFGTSVTEGFYAVPADTGIYRPSGSVIGGHAMTIYGWKQSPSEGEVFLVKNSWSSNWGLNGYCWFPASVLASSEFDAWRALDL